MKIKLQGTIYYTIDKNHPDFKYIKDWKRGKLYEFTDVYLFDADYYSRENAIEYIKRDLALVAGGGYNTEHIHRVKFEIN